MITLDIYKVEDYDIYIYKFNEVSTKKLKSEDFPNEVIKFKSFNIHYPVKDNFLEEDLINKVNEISIKNKFIDSNKINLIEEIVNNFNKTTNCLEQYLTNKIISKMNYEYIKNYDFDSDIFKYFISSRPHIDYFNKESKLYYIKKNFFKKDDIMYKLLNKISNITGKKSLIIKTNFIDKCYLSM